MIHHFPSTFFHQPSSYLWSNFINEFFLMKLKYLKNNSCHLINARNHLVLKNNFSK